MDEQLEKEILAKKGLLFFLAFVTAALLIAVGYYGTDLFVPQTENIPVWVFVGIFLSWLLYRSARRRK